MWENTYKRNCTYDIGWEIPRTFFGQSNAESDSFSNPLWLMNKFHRCWIWCRILTAFCYELQNGDAMMSDSLQIQGLCGQSRYLAVDQYKADTWGRNTNLIRGTYWTILEVKNFFHFSHSTRPRYLCCCQNLREEGINSHYQDWTICEFGYSYSLAKNQGW